MEPAGWFSRWRGVVCALICAAALSIAAGAGLIRGYGQQASFPLPTIDLPKNAKTPAQTSASTPVEPNQRQSAATGGPAEKSDARRPEIARESASLLRMASDLKLAVDKSTKDELSLAVVRKASEIEQLAHKVRTGETARADAK